MQTLECRIKGICKLDPHAGADGTYRIRSCYFDDYKDRYFYENENGTDPREKFRIRTYNGNSSHITLECKKKRNGLNHKDSAALTVSQFEEIVAGKQIFFTDEDPLVRRLYIEGATHMLRPKVIVDYVRTPYVYPDGNVRITFDRNISASDDISAFLKKDIPLVPVMPGGVHILEVKYDDFLPHFIYDLLQTGHLRQTAFSKYYICRAFYKNHMFI